MRLYEIILDEVSWYQDIRLQPKRLMTKKPRRLLPKPIRKIIVKNSSSFRNTFSPIQNIAKTRLARIMLSQGKQAQALELILESKDLTSELYEIKGDAEAALERPTDARISYLQSLDLSQNEVIRNLIRMKIADLQFNVED